MSFLLSMGMELLYSLIVGQSVAHGAHLCLNAARDIC